eukprot:2653365-Alexandrium_andersonii.AAC.1
MVRDQEGASRVLWGVKKDGDVWAEICRVLAVRNPDSVMSEKVKAHLTREEAESAGVPFMQRVGNEWADTMATRGTEAH